MDHSTSDVEQAIPANQIIVLDSQQVTEDDDEEKKQLESANDGNIRIRDVHSSILQDLEISKVISCPETPSPLQGKLVKKSAITKKSSEPVTSVSGENAAAIESKCTEIKISKQNPGIGDEKVSEGEQHTDDTVYVERSSGDEKSSLAKSSSSRELSFKSSQSTSFSSTSLEIVSVTPRSQESSADSAVDTLASHPQKAAIQMISNIESKSSSSSSIYPDISSSSSHHSEGTSNISSSPEFRVPAIIPAHETKENLISSTPAEQEHLSSETSFSCLQLSGEEQRHPVASEYSLPDALTPSPSILSSIERVGVDHLASESDPGLSSNDDLKAPRKSTPQFVLPKWVIERKQIEFHSSSKSSSSSPVDSPTTENVLFQHSIPESTSQQPFTISSQPNVEASPPSLSSAVEQHIDYMDQPDSCIYPVLDIKTCTSPDIIPPSQHQKPVVSITRVKSSGTSSSSVSSDGPRSLITVEATNITHSLSSSSAAPRDELKGFSSNKSHSDVKDTVHSTSTAAVTTESVADQPSLLPSQHGLTLNLERHSDKLPLKVDQKDDSNLQLSKDLFNQPVSSSVQDFALTRTKALNQATPFQVLNNKNNSNLGEKSSLLQKNIEEKEEFSLFLSQSQVDPSYEISRKDQHEESSKNELGSLIGNNQLHLPLPAESQAIHPYMIINSPSRKRTYEEDFEGDESHPKKVSITTSSDVAKPDGCLDSNSEFVKVKQAKRPPKVETDAAVASKEADPFAFSDKDDEDLSPVAKKRKIEKPRTTESTSIKPSFVGDSKIEPDQANLIKVITKTVTKRIMIQEFRTLDNVLLKEISFEECEPPKIAETNIFPRSSLNLDFEEKDEGGLSNKRKSPYKSGKKPSRTSPRVNKNAKAYEKTPEKSNRSRKTSIAITDIQEASTSTKIDLPKIDEPKNEKATEKADYENLVKATLAAESVVTRRQTRSIAKRSISEKETLKIGTRGFGKWWDSCYYPGVITEKVSDERFQMNFDDGSKLVLPAKSIVEHDVLECGQKLFARDSGSSCFCLGTIMNVIRPQHNIQYEVRVDHNKSIKRYKTADIMLSAAQISQLISSSKTVETGNVNHQEAVSTAVNITSDEKRALNKDQVLEKPADISLRKRNRLRREEELTNHLASSSSYEEDSVQQRRRKKYERNIKDRITKDPEQQEREKKDEKRKINEKLSMDLEKEMNDPEFFTEYGPLTKNAKLFQGYAFIITLIEPKAPIKDAEIASLMKGFKRIYLKKQIESAGGVIIHSIKNAVNYPTEKTILISAFNQRTHKYYYAVSSGIICVHHRWVADSCRQDTFLPLQDYGLPAGDDRITRETLVTPKKLKPLTGKRILVKARSDEDEIRMVVIAAGAKIIEELPSEDEAFASYKEEPSCYILVGNSIKLSNKLNRTAREQRIPRVSMDWLAQCIVKGECVSPLEHHSFLYR